MQTLPFTTSEIFFCQWTPGGGKEYFHTIEEAIEKAESHYTKSGIMTDENLAYWKKQLFIIGKEITVSQQIDIIKHVPVS